VKVSVIVTTPENNGDVGSVDEKCVVSGQLSWWPNWD